LAAEHIDRVIESWILSNFSYDEYADANGECVAAYKLNFVVLAGFPEGAKEWEMVFFRFEF